MQITLYKRENYVKKMNFQCGVKYKDIENSYLSHCIKDGFPRLLKRKIIGLKPVLLILRNQRPGLTKLVLIL